MKKLLLGLFVGLIGLVNFGYCDYINNLQFLKNVNTVSYSVYTTSVSSLGVPDEDGLICFYIRSFGGANRFVLSWDNIQNNRYITDMNFISPIFGCVVTKVGYSNYNIIISNANGSGLPFNVDFYFLSSDNASVISGSPFYTSLQCQEEYDLIPVSDIDQNYCVSNGLCPSSECPDIPGSGDNWSALYINDIQHLGKPIINITFPDYLDWDYTTTDNEFNLDIVGYPVDTEYIDGIIRTQNYKPTSEDFTQLVGMLAPYSKYLLFLLFIFIIWAWIKKPFKSKKL